MYDTFKLYTELDICKGEDKVKRDDPDRYKNMIFSGVASDRSKDAEEETLDPKGFVYDRFLKNGLFNLDHLPTRSPINKSRFWIGEPLEASIKDGKFFVKGKLWEKSPEARAFWDKALEMRESGSNRKPGMSVEGKALERDPKNPSRVTKALITNVALTFTPVNPNTYLDIVKSKNFDLNNPYDIQAASILLEYETNGDLFKIDRDGRISIEKSFSSHQKILKQFFESFKQGLISKKIIDDFVENFHR